MRRAPCAPSSFGHHVQLRAFGDYSTQVSIASAGGGRINGESDRRREVYTAEKARVACRRCTITALKPISRFGGWRSMPAADRRVRRRPDSIMVIQGKELRWQDAGK
jgi:hypothetical protein